MVTTKEISSQELLYQIGQYLARVIPRTRRLKFVQIKTFKNLLVWNYLANFNQHWWEIYFGDGIQICSNKGEK